MNPNQPRSIRSVTGIVLAGGASSRFGDDKLHARLDGQTLLEQAIAAVRQVADEVVVAVPAGAAADIEGGGVRLVADRAHFAGPLAAVADVLTELDDGRAIVVGGDMPLLVPEVLRAMLARLDDASVEAALLAAPTGAPGAMRRQVLPLALAIRPARDAAQAAMRDGRRSLRGLLEHVAVAEIPASSWLALDPEGRTVLDVDTSEDLDRIRAAYAR